MVEKLIGGESEEVDEHEIDERSLPAQRQTDRNVP